MLKIEHLDVRLDVEGEGDEAVFAKLFDKYIRLWNRLAEEAKARHKMAEAHRSLGDHSPHEG